jgi:hypothetical protein
VSASVVYLNHLIQQYFDIEYRQRSITIRDPEGLQLLACECYRADHARLKRLF